MSRLVTDADEAPADWRDEDWARRAANLSAAERRRRIGAVSVLMDGADDISDGLYSELVVFLEALQGDDLTRAAQEVGA